MEKEEIEEEVQQMIDVTLILTERILETPKIQELQAKIAMRLFTAFKEEGFSNEAALELTAATIKTQK